MPKIEFAPSNGSPTFNGVKLPVLPPSPLGGLHFPTGSFSLSAPFQNSNQRPAEIVRGHEEQLWKVGVRVKPLYQREGEPDGWKLVGFEVSRLRRPGETSDSLAASRLFLVTLTKIVLDPRTGKISIAAKFSPKPTDVVVQHSLIATADSGGKIVLPGADGTHSVGVYLPDNFKLLPTASCMVELTPLDEAGQPFILPLRQNSAHPGGAMGTTAVEAWLRERSTRHFGYFAAL